MRKSGKALSESQAVATRQMQAFAQAGNVASQSQMQATRQMEAYQKAGGLTIPIQNQLIGNVKNTVAALQQKASSLKAVTTRLTEYNDRAKQTAQGISLLTTRTQQNKRAVDGIIKSYNVASKAAQGFGSPTRAGMPRGDNEWQSRVIDDVKRQASGAQECRKRLPGV